MFAYLFWLCPYEVLLVLGYPVEEEGGPLDQFPHSGEDVEGGRGTLFCLYESGVDLTAHELPFNVYVGLNTFVS